jgi:hypothetical protein
MLEPSNRIRSNRTFAGGQSSTIRVIVTGVELSLVNTHTTSVPPTENPPRLNSEHVSWVAVGSGGLGLGVAVGGVGIGVELGAGVWVGGAVALGAEVLLEAGVGVPGKGEAGPGPGS